MDVNAGIKKISLIVYCTDNLITCDVLEVVQNRIKASPCSGKVDMFQTGYPVVCMYLSDGVLEYRGGEIADINIKASEISILITFEEVKEERRIFERYPVSLEVSARRKFSNKRFLLLAKNLSEYGMGAISSADLDMDESIDMNLIAGRYMFYFVGKVIWKQEMGSVFDYGFQLTEFDVTTKASMENYLAKLKEEYKKLFEKSKAE
ncbi:MAG: PilZ domain-containing protein [Clostridiales bacterium]|nr:PilZ domain-containing protein [Clostridiales bacterium]